MGSRVIAFTGSQGVGKTVLAQALTRYSRSYENLYSYKLSYADKLRDIVKYDLFNGLNDGMYIAQASVNRATKEKPLNEFLPLYGINTFFECSPRELLIALGTFCRSINKGYFCDALHKTILDHQKAHGDINIYIDDLRFENEYETLREFCIDNNIECWIIGLNRKNIPDSGDHLIHNAYKVIGLPEVEEYSDEMLKEILYLIKGE